MIWALGAISLCFVGCKVLDILYARSIKKVAYLVHIQGRTEADEHMDFAVSLFEDESEGVWDEKLSRAFELREKRLAFQNKRVIDLMKPSEEPKKE
jgi:hypothetical protein